MKVFIYWNLHRKMWSVRCQKTRKVIDHLAELSLTDCQFKVSEKGRQRVLRERRKNVHAGVIGTINNEMITFEAPNKICYNPYKQSTFTCNGEPIKEAKLVRFLADRTVYAS